VVVLSNPRRNPAYAFISIPDTQAYSYYHALQTSFSKRFADRWQSQISYTWSKSIDNASGTFGLDGSIGAGGEINPYDPRYSHGLSNFSRKHNFRASGIYELPFRASGAAGKLVEGWSLTGIYSYLSGIAFSPGTAAGSLYSGSPVAAVGQPDGVAGCRLYPDTQTLTNWFNPNCFTLPRSGTYGNAGRNSIIGPNLWVADASLMKDTRIREGVTLQFRAEAFNILNHPSFQNPQNQIFSGFTYVPNGAPLPANVLASDCREPIGAGQICAVRNGQAGVINRTNSQPRQIQLSLKIIF